MRSAVMRPIGFSIDGHKPVKRRVRKIKAGGFFYDFVSSSKVESKKPAPPERFPEAEVVGIAMLLISAGVIWLASTGATVEERDCTAVLLTIPAGVYLLFTRHIVIA